MNRPSFVLGTILGAIALSLTACSKEPAAEKPAEKKAPAAAAASPAKPAETPAIVAATPAPAYATVDQQVSYGLGYNMGASLSREKILTVDQEALKAGLADGLSGAKTRVSEEDLRTAFTTVQQKAATAAAAAAEKQQAASAEFLVKNKARAGVIETASGLQYEVLKQGSGPKPKPANTVQVHYHGTLLDGTVFDSSVERGQPAEFQVDGVIQGWIEALQLMSVGDKFKLYIPAKIGYGARAAGKIPPNSLLIFEVELLAIK